MYEENPEYNIRQMKLVESFGMGYAHEGRIGGLSIRGDTLYSYTEPIATLVSAGVTESGFQPVYKVKRQSLHSDPTTARHLKYAQEILPKFATVQLVSPDEPGMEDKGTVIRYLPEQQEDLIEKFIAGATVGAAGGLSIQGDNLYSTTEPIVMRGNGEVWIKPHGDSRISQQHINLARKVVESSMTKTEQNPRVKIGDKIKILNRDGQYGKWTNRLWTISHIAYSKAEHQGYDEGVGGPLVSCKGLPISLYDWEFEIVESNPRITEKPQRMERSQLHPYFQTVREQYLRPEERKLRKQVAPLEQNPPVSTKRQQELLSKIPQIREGRGAKPPKEWLKAMTQVVKQGYGRIPKERLARITCGIWHQYPPQAKIGIIERIASGTGGQYPAGDTVGIPTVIGEQNPRGLLPAVPAYSQNPDPDPISPTDPFSPRDSFKPFWPRTKSAVMSTKAVIMSEYQRRVKERLARQDAEFKDAAGKGPVTVYWIPGADNKAMRLRIKIIKEDLEKRYRVPIQVLKTKSQQLAQKRGRRPGGFEFIAMR